MRTFLFVTAVAMQERFFPWYICSPFTSTWYEAATFFLSTRTLPRSKELTPLLRFFLLMHRGMFSGTGWDLAPPELELRDWHVCQAAGSCMAAVFRTLLPSPKKTVLLKMKKKCSPSSACGWRQTLPFSSVQSTHAFINREVIFGLSSLTSSCWWSCKRSTPLSFQACYQLFFSV